MKNLWDIKETLEAVHLMNETAGKMGRDQKYNRPTDDPDHKASKHYKKEVMPHIMKHEKSGKYKVNHSFGGTGPKPSTSARSFKGKVHYKPDITMHYPPVADRHTDAIGYTVHHDGEAANDTKLHAKSMHNFKN